MVLVEGLERPAPVSAFGVDDQDGGDSRHKGFSAWRPHAERSPQDERRTGDTPFGLTEAVIHSTKPESNRGRASLYQVAPQ